MERHRQDQQDCSLMQTLDGGRGKVSGRRSGERGGRRCEMSTVRLQEKETEATQRLGHMRRKELCHAELEVVKFLEKGHNPQVQASSTKSYY